jgi:hypothetical protein
MYKHELCLGPMSINDEDEPQYQSMLSNIRNIRGSYSRLKIEFNNLANSLGMKETPVDNCTRLPIAFMKSCGWVETVNDKSLYGKSMTCLKITQHGIDVYNSIKDMVDVRLDTYLSSNENVKMSLIRLGMYSMLIRAGYDLSNIKNEIDSDKQIARDILRGRDLLFSPCQTIARKAVENALNIKIDGNNESTLKLSTFDSLANDRNSLSTISIIDLNLEKIDNNKLLTNNTDIKFLSSVFYLKNKGYSSSQIVDVLFQENITATQTVFYPLISTLFKVMGLNCSFSRPGDNGSRWDAIIEDSSRSIPIEIKSPTEEQHLSIKAIRQALENKIVLLSRKTFITDIETTSLAVGYYLPNERAEVCRLISDIKTTFGYKIGVIDFKSLLSIAVSILIDHKGFDISKIYTLEGLINANIQ